jgi:four helix bundle protein
MGSASEAEYQLQLAHELKYLGSERYDQLSLAIQEVKMMLASLIRRAP